MGSLVGLWNYSRLWFFHVFMLNIRFRAKSNCLFGEKKNEKLPTCVSTLMIYRLSLQVGMVRANMLAGQVRCLLYGSWVVDLSW